MRRFRAFPDFSSFEYTTTVDESVYRLRFRYHPRCEGWYVDLMEPDGTEILMGTRVVLGWPLFQGHVDPRLPPGLMLALDMDGDGVELVEQSGLGDRVRLVYVSRDELGFSRSSVQHYVVEHA